MNFKSSLFLRSHGKYFSLAHIFEVFSIHIQRNFIPQQAERRLTPNNLLTHGYIITNKYRTPNILPIEELENAPTWHSILI